MSDLPPDPWMDRAAVLLAAMEQRDTDRLHRKCLLADALEQAASEALRGVVAAFHSARQAEVHGPCPICSQELVPERGPQPFASDGVLGQIVTCASGHRMFMRRNEEERPPRSITAQRLARGGHG